MGEARRLKLGKTLFRDGIVGKVSRLKLDKILVTASTLNKASRPEMIKTLFQEMRQITSNFDTMVQ